MNASNLLNFLACLTIIATAVPSAAGEPASAEDLADAHDMAAFWWSGSVGSQTHLPDGRSLTHL
jgi:hypothetical protein